MPPAAPAPRARPARAPRRRAPGAGAAAAVGVWTAAALLLVLLGQPGEVQGHGFLRRPRSRNWLAAEDGTFGTRRFEYLGEGCP